MIRLSHATRRLAAVNDKIAIHSNRVFASMAFFWVCLIFSLLPLKWPATMPFVQYASSGVLQLIALPLIGVGTILAARQSDQAAKEQHDAVIETVQAMHELIVELHEMHKELRSILFRPSTGAFITAEPIDHARKN